MLYNIIAYAYNPSTLRQEDRKLEASLGYALWDAASRYYFKLRCILLDMTTVAVFVTGKTWT